LLIAHFFSTTLCFRSTLGQLVHLGSTPHGAFT